MSKKVISQKSGESLVIKAGDFIFIAGQLGNIDNQGKPLNGIESQTRQCIENINTMLQSAGASFSQSVKVDVMLKNSSDQSKMRTIYNSLCLEEGKSKRTTHIVAGLQTDALIEMDCIAYRPPGKESANHHSQAVIAGDFIFATGRRGRVDSEGKPLDGIEAQTKQCLGNVKSMLQTAGASLSDAVKITILLTNPNDFDKMEQVYQSYFPIDPPVRTIHLVSGFNPEELIVMDCMAYCPK